MKKRKLFSLLLASVLVLSLVSFSASAAEDTKAVAGLAAAELAAQYGGATSVQYALWENGKLTVTGHTGVYSKTENRALTDDTLYGVGSVSKVYTTAAVMSLVEAGKVALDKPVTTYLPEFTMADTRYLDITVRMLINHSSGLLGSSMNNGFLFDDPLERSATDELLERLKTQNLKADPGAFSVYCNDGFTLAQLVVERVSGQSLSKFLQEKVFVPNGMKNTYLPGDTFDTDRLAKTYLGTDTRALPAETLGIHGTGGLYATAGDLAAFGGLLCGTELLTAQSLDEMAAPEYKNGLWPADDEATVSYGLGWDAVEYPPFANSGIRALVKGGDTTLYHGGLVVLPEHNMAAAVLSSGGLSAYNQMAAAKLLVAALTEKGVKVDERAHTLPVAEPAALPEGELQNAGLYGSSTQVVPVGITADGGMTLAGQTFRYHSDDSYRDETGTILVKFVEEKNGETYLWQKAYADLPGLGEMPVSDYAFLKLKENPVSPSVQQAWDARSGKTYLALNQKYTAQAYAMALPMAGLATDPVNQPGYMVFDKLVDENTAVGVAVIPGTAGRDWQNLNITQRDGVEILEIAGAYYADSTHLKPLFTGAEAYCTIQSDGYARWYQVGPSAGKTLAVAVPEHGAFNVYDADGLPVAGSWTWGDTSAVLPEGGWIVFAGDPGVQFHLTATAPATLPE